MRHTYPTPLSAGERSVEIYLRFAEVDPQCSIQHDTVAAAARKAKGCVSDNR